jgi:hypothetical protein
MDLDVWEVVLIEELEHGLHLSNGRDLSVELDMAHVCVNKIDGEWAAEAEQLSWLVMRIPSVLVDLGMVPVQDIP